MTSYKKLLEYLHYGNEELAVKAFHEITDNRYKSGLKLLMPLTEIDSSGKFKDHSGNGFDGTPDGDITTVGHGKSKCAFGNGIPSTDTSRITISGVNFGTNDLSMFMVCQNYAHSGTAGSVAVIMDSYLSGTQRFGLVMHGSTFSARQRINGDVSINNNAVLRDGSPHSIAIAADRSANSLLYYDTEIKSTMDISGSVASVMDLGTWRLFGGDVGTFTYTQNSMKWFMLFEDRLLSQEEVNELHELLTPNIIGVP